MFRSVSFWILFWSALIGLIVGSYTHWIVGTILFFIIAGKTLMIGLVMDTISTSLEYHHDRQDERMKKTMESIKYLTKTSFSAGSNIISRLIK